MRSIIDNPACWGTWEEPGVQDAPATAAGEAASCDLAGTASSGAAMITFRRHPLAARNIDEAIAEVGRLEITRSDALGDYGFIREARSVPLNMDAIRKELDKGRKALAEDVLRAEDTLARAFRDHIKYGTGVAAIGVAPASAIPVADSSASFTPIFTGTYYIPLGVMDTDLEYGEGAAKVSAHLSKDATRGDVVRLLRKFADAIEQGGDS